MLHQLKNRNFYVLLVADSGLFVGSLVAAYLVRFGFAIPQGEYQRFLSILPFVLLVKLGTFFTTRVYRGLWRYTSIPDALNLARATLISTLLLVAGITFFNHFQGYSRFIFVADGIFTLFLCGALRMGIRFVFAHRRLQAPECAAPRRPARHTRLLVLGAGDAADKLIREVQGNRWSPYEIVCCLDDSPSKHHHTLLGVPVHGPLEALSVFASKYQAEELIIAMPSVTGARMRAIIAFCRDTGRPFRTLPSISSLIDGQVTVNDLRPVNYEDLLGRPPVRLDLDDIGRYLTGKRVAVTGAGGSIGSELCRQVLRFHPAALILIEGSEYNLYRMEMELRTERKYRAVFPAMGRVQDRPLMERIFARHRPEVVFHAAACKHVPMMELNPWEAVFNNVIGSQVIMDVAEAHGVERAVFISTDKAVRPTNVMGASKRVVEILLQDRPPGRTRFMAVRFGNVVGSSGSAIPLFQSQIKAGGPVTVTDPEMTRYFMTIPEACQLVLQAGALGEGGEIFILEMGTPVKIADMARDLIRLSGKEPDRDIQIVYTGLRPGEKLHEELITHGEGIVPTPHEKIMVLRRHPSIGPNPYKPPRVWLERLVADAHAFEAPLIRASLCRLVPDYVPSEIVSVLCAPAQPVASLPG